MDNIYNFVYLYYIHLDKSNLCGNLYSEHVKSVRSRIVGDWCPSHNLTIVEHLLYNYMLYNTHVCVADKFSSEKGYTLNMLRVYYI